MRTTREKNLTDQLVLYINMWVLFVLINGYMECMDIYSVDGIKQAITYTHQVKFNLNNSIKNFVLF